MNTITVIHCGFFLLVGLVLLTAEAIQGFFDDVEDIAGRAEQIFVVGKGLSKAGAKILGEQLANMSIGDIEAMLETNKVDPFAIQKIIKEFIELARAIVCILVKVTVLSSYWKQFYYSRILSC